MLCYWTVVERRGNLDLDADAKNIHALKSLFAVEEMQHPAFQVLLGSESGIGILTHAAVA
jgi:hypothetical protein